MSTSGSDRGSEARLRDTLEPLFEKYGVMAGHDRFYERVKPQQGIAYFVVGSGGQLRSGNTKKGGAMAAKAFDTDHAFLAAENQDPDNSALRRDVSPQPEG